MPDVVRISAVALGLAVAGAGVLAGVRLPWPPATSALGEWASGAGVLSGLGSPPVNAEVPAARGPGLARAGEAGSAAVPGDVTAGRAGAGLPGGVASGSTGPAPGTLAVSGPGGADGALPTPPADTAGGPGDLSGPSLTGGAPGGAEAGGPAGITTTGAGATGATAPLPPAGADQADRSGPPGPIAALILVLVAALVLAALVLWWPAAGGDDPLAGPPWARALLRRLEREGARRGRPRQPDETVAGYAGALAASVLPDRRVGDLGAALSAALFDPARATEGGDIPPEWSAVLDDVCRAHPAARRRARTPDPSPTVAS